MSRSGTVDNRRSRPLCAGPVSPARPQGPAKSLVALALAGVLLLLHGPSSAQIFKDSEAREGLEQLRQRLNQAESSMQVRQMGLGEQIQGIREELVRIEALVEENRRFAGQVDHSREVGRIEMQEALVQMNRDHQKQFQTVDENLKRLLKGIEDLQANIRTLNDNLQSMSEFEKTQEGRISQIQAQLQNQIAVVVEEVSQENTRIRQEVSLVRGELAGIVEAVNSLDGRLRQAAVDIEELGRRQDALARAGASPGSGGQHVVQKGETLSIISQRYGVSLQDIMAANSISDPNLIRVGQTLSIPGR